MCTRFTLPAVLGGVLVFSAVPVRPVSAQLLPNEIVYVTGGLNHTAELRRLTIPANTSQRITNRCPISGGTAGDCYFRDPAPGPDGTRIAFGIESGNTELPCRSIWTIDYDGRNTKRLTTGCSDHDASWSPDGRLIVFARRGSGPTRGIHLIQACNGRAPYTTTRRLTAGISPSFSRDGDWVVFAEAEDIWKIRTDGSQLTNLTNGQGRNSDPRWTKAGTPTTSRDPDIYDRIIFVSTRDGRGDIYSMNATGGDVQRLTSTSSTKLHPDFNNLPISYVYADGSDLMVKRTSAAPGRVGSGQSPRFGVVAKSVPMCPR